MSSDVSQPMLPRSPRRWLRYTVRMLLVLAVVIALWLALVPINLTLYVSNQSPAVDPVDVQVEVDGQLVANDQFRFGDGHTQRRFVLPLRLGWHRIDARTVKGESVLQSEFSMFWSRWAVLNYWYYPDKPDVPWPRDWKTPKHFSFNIWSKPPAFD